VVPRSGLSLITLPDATVALLAVVTVPTTSPGSGDGCGRGRLGVTNHVGYDDLRRAGGNDQVDRRAGVSHWCLRSAFANHVAGCDGGAARGGDCANHQSSSGDGCGRGLPLGVTNHVGHGDLRPRRLKRPG